MKYLYIEKSERAMPTQFPLFTTPIFTPTKVGTNAHAPHWTETPVPKMNVRKHTLNKMSSISSNGVLCAIKAWDNVMRKP